MKEIVIIGGGGHAHACIDVLEQTNEFKIAHIVDTKENIGRNILGYKVDSCDEDLESIYKTFEYFHIAIGQVGLPEKRRYFFDLLKENGCQLPRIISPHAYVSKHAFVDEGTIVMHQAIVNASARIGKNCIINSKALIEHDAIVEDHCHIATGAIINGNVHVGKASFMGSGCITRQGASVAAGTFVKAGSLIK